MSLKNTAASNTPSEAHVDSLPWSLRHCGPDQALDEARHLAVFLEDVLTSSRSDGLGNVGTGNWGQGLSQCFLLLIDKLDIAAEVYSFPALSLDKDAPRLCERKK